MGKKRTRTYKCLNYGNDCGKSKEIRVYVINCDSGFDFRSAEQIGDYEGIMVKAEELDSVYSLEYFQDEVNSENLMLTNSFILIR